MLVDLAAGRDPCEPDLVPEILPIAREHRVAGLLWTWARHRDVDPDLKKQLAIYDLYVQGHLGRVWSVLESVATRLHAIDLDVATVKGVTAEARWYGRRGERPCSDVDLVLAPDQLGRAADVLELIQPDHPWRPHVNAMATSGRVPGVTLMVDGLEVDLHFDLLKFGVPSRQARELWASTRPYVLPGGESVRVLDDTPALFHLLLHLNKDRFQRLLGFADVPRIIGAGQVDWEHLLAMAQRDGIEVPVLRSLGTVVDVLALEWPTELRRPRGPRSWAWGVLWRPSIQLRGREGRLRFRRRQDWIALLARGRAREALAWWLRDLLPPAPTVAAHYGHIRGPYAWKLLRGRLEAAVQQRRALARRRPSGDTPA